MDAGSDWREIDAHEESLAKGTAVVGDDDKVPRWLIGAVVAVVTGVCALLIWITLPSGGVAIEASEVPFDAHVAARSGPLGGSFAVVQTSIVVDVEGAVAHPGLHQLSSDSRVGDAIEAAGGYAPDIDIEASSRTLNLAQKVTDGQQIRVPALGDAAVVPTSGGGGAATGTGSSAPAGLIDLNHASADELDTLPGIGPVTAAKIIDARTSEPFATVDELQSRGVVGPSTFEKLRDLVTVTP